MLKSKRRFSVIDSADGAILPTGALIEDWGDDLEEMSPLEVTLPGEPESDTVVPVTLEIRVTEIGTLELWCVSAERPDDRWKLELNIRERE